MSKSKQNKHHQAMIRRVYANLGALQAEHDTQLAQYYIGPGDYVDRAMDFSDPAMVFRGPKGVGKSAILRMVELRSRSVGVSSLRITPDDLAFTALANVEINTPLLKSAVHNQWLFKCLWDYVLSVRLLTQEFQYRQKYLSKLFAMFSSKDERLARRLIEMSFAEEATGDVSLTSTLLRIVREVEVSVEGYGIKASTSPVSGGESKNEQHLSVLNTVNRVAKALPELLESDYYVLIDDLDLHWNNEPTQNALIAALFTSMSKFRNNKKAKFIIAIRDDIYRCLPIEDKDKSRDWISDVSWDYLTLQTMLERRMESLHRVSPTTLWSNLMPPKAFDTMVAHSRGRPRELIRQLVLCFETACQSQHHQVQEVDLEGALRKYSAEKIEEADQELKHMYPGLAMVLKFFTGMRREFALEDLHDACTRIAIAVIDQGESCLFKWAGAFADEPKGLAKILASIGFLNVKTSRTAFPQEVSDGHLIDTLEAPWFAIATMYCPGLGVYNT